MRSVLLLFVMGFACAGLTAAPGPERTGVVAVNILNVRNRPDAAAASVVAKLKRGDSVRIIKQNGEWLEIAAPENTSVYVFAQFFVNGKTTRDVNLRTGPGVEFQSYGIAPAGTELTAAGELKNGWQKVKPLSTMSCYASARYIRENTAKTPAQSPVKETAKVPAPEKKAAVSAAGPAAPAPAAAVQQEPVSQEDMKLLQSQFLEDSAKTGEWEGKLLPVRKSSLGALRYALAAPGNKLQPICHLTMADLSACAGFVGQTVKVKGTMYQVSGWKLPVVVALAITPSNAK